MFLFVRTVVLLLFIAFNVIAQSSFSSITVEESRISAANSVIPLQMNQLSQRVQKLQLHLSQARNYTSLMQLIIRHGTGLWKDAVKQNDSLQNFDDRPLYWARLKMTSAIRKSSVFKQALPDQQQKLLWKFELLSRGLSDVQFNQSASKKVLLMGFDPFLLDKHIDQSNPSGVAALSLDDFSMSVGGNTVEIETVILPVRYDDFDHGIVEQMLTEILNKYDVDLLLTANMGQNTFDLSHYVGKRRSSSIPDNNNKKSSGTLSQPEVPRLNGDELIGQEFRTINLPVDAILNVRGRFKVTDNRQITTLMKTYKVNNINELNGQISVKGSAGGFLSNELAYRSLLVRDKISPLLPTGHIQIPKVNGFDKQTTIDIVQQLKSIISVALSSQ